jgi:hypothetical protein
MRPVFGKRHHGVGALDPLVLGQVELDLDDDAERAVAADRAEEEVRVLAAAAFDQAAVVQGELEARTESTSGPRPT